MTIQEIKALIKSIFDFNECTISKMLRDENIFRLNELELILNTIKNKIGCFHNGDVKYKITDCWTKNRDGDSILDLLSAEQLNVDSIMGLVDVLIDKYKLFVKKA